MQEFGDRIKFVRKTNGLSQQAFGERLGVGRDVINNMENDRVKAKDHFIKLICLEFDVNEGWLRNSEGEMTIQKERGLAEFIAYLKKGKNKRASDFIDSIAALSEEDLEKLLDGIEVIKKLNT